MVANVFLIYVFGIFHLYGLLENLIHSVSLNKYFFFLARNTEQIVASIKSSAWFYLMIKSVA